MPLQELEQSAEADPDSEQYDNARHGLQACVSVVQLLLQATKPDVPQLLTDIVLELHDHALLNLFRSPSVQEAVSRLCIAYYLADAPDAAQVSPQMVCPLNCSLPSTFGFQHFSSVPWLPKARCATRPTSSQDKAGVYSFVVDQLTSKIMSKTGNVGAVVLAVTIAHCFRSLFPISSTSSNKKVSEQPSVVNARGT